ncbi:MAG: YncE family protein [Acidobacteria bacterium]|nr:YncE family protein [Acidobacteriota bacterium]
MQMREAVSLSIVSGLRGGSAAILALVGIFVVAASPVFLRTKRSLRQSAVLRPSPAVSALLLAWLIAPTAAHAIDAYITSSGGNTVSVIDTATNTVIATITLDRPSAGVAVTPDGSKVYIANGIADTVSVIDTATNTVIATIPVGGGFEKNPFGVAVTSDGSKVYVANETGTVSVIDTATNTVIATIPIGLNPTLLAVAPPRPDGRSEPQNEDRERRCRLHQDDEGQTDGQEDKKMARSKVYVAGSEGNTVVVIDTATDTVIARIPVGRFPFGVAVTPDGCKVYVANDNDATVSVIATASDTVIGSPIPVGFAPAGVAVAPNGRRVYVTFDTAVSVIETATDTVIGSPIPVGRSPTAVAVTPNSRKVYVENFLDNTVSVIATKTNTVIATIPVDRDPDGHGLFIQPGPRFAGIPGFSNCHGQSVSALVQQFNGLNAAAEALGFRTISGLEEAVLEFCED